MFYTIFIQLYLVLQGGGLSAHLLGCICVLAQAPSEWGAFGRIKVDFWSIHYLGLALDSGWYKP